MTVADMPADCDLCAADLGRYDWSKVCCRSRFITSLPRVVLRRGWMERWKARESAEFYADIQRVVTARWENKKGNTVIVEDGNV